MGTLALTPSTNYTNGMNCSVVIINSDATATLLVITALSLGAGDNVTVYDGASAAAAVLASFSSSPATAVPSTLQSATGTCVCVQPVCVPV